MFTMLAQEVIGPAPQIHGLSPTLQFFLTLATMLVPLLVAVLKARANGRVADTVIAGVETAAEAVGDSPEMKAVLAKAARGEPVTRLDLEKIAMRFKSGIQKVAIEEGVEAALAPRVKDVTSKLEPAELTKRLLAPPLLFFALLLPGCCSVTAHDVAALREAIEAERECVAPRAGFEAAVKKNRDAVDDHLEQQRRAHQ